MEAHGRDSVTVNENGVDIYSTPFQNSANVRRGAAASQLGRATAIRWIALTLLLLRRGRNFARDSRCSIIREILSRLLQYRRGRATTRGRRIVLEIPYEISGLRNLRGVASHRDGRDARGRKVISAAPRADVRIDDVRRLLRRKTRERNRLRAQCRTGIQVGAVHRGNEYGSHGDPDRNHERGAAQHYDDTPNAPAMRRAGR